MPMSYKLCEKTLPTYYNTKFRKWTEKTDRIRIIDKLL